VLSEDSNTEELGHDNQCSTRLGENVLTRVCSTSPIVILSNARQMTSNTQIEYLQQSDTQLE